MSIVTAQGLGKYYGAQDVFSDVEFAIAHGDKVALVGPNGAGKTTLLRILLGMEEPSAGSVQRARGLRIGYLPQKPVFPSDRTLYAEMLSLFEALRAQQRALEALAEEMAAAKEPGELLQRYAETEQRFDLAGGYTYEERIARVLGGLGFGPDTFSWPIAVLSGGQVTRALLAKLLLQEPELLVLDEPTNYLDLEALEWLEGYLGEWPQSLLIVSHDRYFLDKVVTRVWELNYGRLDTYRGNYSAYVLQREAHMERQRREYEQQQEQIAKTEDFIRRYKAGQRSKQARGRETILERTERIAPPPPQRQIQLRMSSTLRAGDNVLMSDGATIGYETRPEAAADAAADARKYALFDTGEFLIQRGQRVALLGANGSGKTTFLRTILGQVEPLAGRIRHGASVRIGYLPQTRDWLDPRKTILEQLMAVDDKLLVAQARHILGRFLFSGDDVYKPISTLSGGELSRVALAILTMKGANFLLLDEPTTHLDVESQEVLQSVLTRFNGTILLVSHDRYLMDALATHLWVIEGGRMRQFEGNYSAYVQALQREREQRAARVEEGARPAGAVQRDERRRERQAERAVRQHADRTLALEGEIARLEHELANVAGLLDLASSTQDLERVRSLSLEYQRLGTALAEQMRLWEEWMGHVEE